MNNFQNKIFNALWSYMKNQYSRERYKQENTTSMPKKHKGITVYCRVEWKKVKNIFGCLNIDDVKASGHYFYDHEAKYYVIHSSMSFMKRERGEWIRSGLAYLDYFILDNITLEDVEELDDLLRSNLNDFFDTKYQEECAKREDNAKQYREKETRKKELWERFKNKEMTKEEAIELAALAYDEEAMDLFALAYS